jgi:hypothetical protein
MTIDKVTAEAIMDDLRDVVAEVFGKYGLAAPKMRGKYGHSLQISFEATRFERGEGGINVQSQEAQYYKTFGFKTLSGTKLEAPLGTKFSSSGKEYIFAGIAAKRRKYPIYCLHADTLAPTLFTDHAVTLINSAAKKAEV